MTPPRLRTGTAALALGLVLATLAAYARAPGFDFVAVDDNDYVTANPWVKDGLSWAGLRWAFSEAWASNWHPLTWLSHQLDVTLFGLDPAGHHAVSVALHALNAVLCFAALLALTGRRTASFLCAGLFALHPLRVESVAWVSERKDLLAGLFFFLTLLGLARATRAGHRRPALRPAVVVPFALGLMAKPMLVTVPVVLWLLEWWPLGGSEESSHAGTSDSTGAPSLAPTRPGRTPGLRSGFTAALEKLPLLGLAVVSCTLTLWSQSKGGSLYTLDAIPLADRLANAPLAVARYVEHLLVPHDLAFFYPHRALVAPDRPAWEASNVVAAVVLVLALVILARYRRRAPAVVVGVQVFLVMLVPVVGIVQVGEQAWADRYAYLPTLGLTIALVFPLEASLREGRVRNVAGFVATLALATLGLLTFRQTATWRDSEALFQRGLAVTEGNYPAHVGLANLRAENGRTAEARSHYEAALAIRPDYAPAQYGLGLLEQRLGNGTAAIARYRAAIASLPQLAAAHLNLGALLGAEGDVVGAAECFERVLEVAPGHPDAHFNLAQLLLASGRAEAALPHLEATLATRPDMHAAREALGRTLETLGRDAEAISILREGPVTPGARLLLAWLLATTPQPGSGDGPEALRLMEGLVRADETDPRKLEVWAAALAACGRFERACEVQESVLARASGAAASQARRQLECYRERRPFQHEH
jgi:Tfp pilus assembly protein PilF